jgi:hypothetical protein
LWPSSKIELEFRNVDFCGEEKRRKPLEARENQQTNSTHIWQRVRESNPGQQWWEASAHTAMLNEAQFSNILYKYYKPCVALVQEHLVSWILFLLGGLVYSWSGLYAQSIGPLMANKNTKQKEQCVSHMKYRKLFFLKKLQSVYSSKEGYCWCSGSCISQWITSYFTICVYFFSAIILIQMPTYYTFVLVNTSLTLKENNCKFSTNNLLYADKPLIHLYI